ncbi:MAG TPA: hypothetical protein VFE42_00455 [Chloroflexota bacterium]|nr:hypothetical protein [Chloroflexota bacterium]
MSKRYPARLVATAYHEAGHAAVAFDLGIRVRGASIIPDGDALGHVLHGFERWVGEIAYDVTPYREARIHRHIMVCLAGAEAEALHRHRYNHAGAWGDRETAIALANYLVGSSEECEALLAWLTIRTRNRLRSARVHRYTAAVADALLERQRLSAEQLGAVLRAAQAALRPPPQSAR